MWSLCLQQKEDTVAKNEHADMEEDKNKLKKKKNFCTVFRGCVDKDDLWWGNARRRALELPQPCSSLSSESSSCIPGSLIITVWRTLLSKSAFTLPTCSCPPLLVPPPPAHPQLSPLQKLSQGGKWIIAGTWESFSDNIITWGCVFGWYYLCVIKTRLK